MQALDLQFNDFGDAGAVHLSTCLDKVEKLNIWNCGVGMRGLEALVHKIKERKTPVTLLLTLINIHNALLGR